MTKWQSIDPQYQENVGAALLSILGGYKNVLVNTGTFPLIYQRHESLALCCRAAMVSLGFGDPEMLTGLWGAEISEEQGLIHCWVQPLERKWHDFSSVTREQICWQMTKQMHGVESEAKAAATAGFPAVAERNAATREAFLAALVLLSEGNGAHSSKDDHCLPGDGIV